MMLQPGQQLQQPMPIDDIGTPGMPIGQSPYVTQQGRPNPAAMMQGLEQIYGKPDEQQGMTPEELDRFMAQWMMQRDAKGGER